MVTVVQGEHDTIVTLKATGEEVRRYKGRRTLSSVLVEFAEESGFKDPKITSGSWGTIMTVKNKDGSTTRYRATYARPK